jgi:Berberine and berberine like
MVPFKDTTDENLGQTAFTDFLALETISDTTGIHPYMKQNSLLNEFAPHGPRAIMNGFNYQSLSVALLQYAVDALKAYIAKLGEDYARSIILFEGYPHGKVCEIPHNATAFPNRTSSFRTAICMRWKGAQHDAWVSQWVKEFVEGAQSIDKSVSEDEKKGGNTGYANFISPQTNVRDVFASNLQRLQEIKREWDPQGRFNKWFNPGTKV